MFGHQTVTYVLHAESDSRSATEFPDNVAVVFSTIYCEIRLGISFSMQGLKSSMYSSDVYSFSTNFISLINRGGKKLLKLMYCQCLLRRNLVFSMMYCMYGAYRLKPRRYAIKRRFTGATATYSHCVQRRNLLQHRPLKSPYPTVIGNFRNDNCSLFGTAVHLKASFSLSHNRCFFSKCLYSNSSILQYRSNPENATGGVSLSLAIKL